jgi:alcohol dehydrogenase
MTLPPFLTSQTAMDAMTHAFEAYTCLSKNPLSDSYALEAISLISKNVVNVVKNPDNVEGRLNLAVASTLAGVAFSNSTVGMVHTLGHSIGAVLHIPHGTCMAIILPYALEYNMHKIEGYTAELLWAIAGEEVYANTRAAQRAEKTIDYVRKLNQDLSDATDGKHYTRLKDILDRDGKQAVSRESLKEIARVALGDGSIFYNPEELDYEDCLMVLEAAYEGVKLDRERVKKG